MFESRTIAALYAVFATVALMLVALAMPPFQNADEPAHVRRADQISHLRLLGENLRSGASGGHIDAGIYDAASRFDTIPFHRENKVTRAMYAPMPWGPQIEAGFPGAAIYPPLFYLPAAAAMAAARMAGAPVLYGLYAARIAGGAFSIALGAVAVALAGDAAIWLFAVMLLPMSFCLSAAVSQDAPMLAMVALAVALCRRAMAADGGVPVPQGIASRRRWLLPLLGATALLVAVGMARPPYSAFALLLLAFRAPWRYRVAAFVSVPAMAVAWSLLNAKLVRLPVYADGIVDPVAQLHGLLVAPAKIFSLMQATWHVYDNILMRGFIGYPGWLDVDLPDAFFPVAYAMLAVALAVALGGVCWRRTACLAAPVAILAACGGMAFLQYLTWTKVGSPVLDGLQGRYFLAPALLLAALPARAAVPSRWVGLAQAAVLAFPVISIPVTVHAILIRYYF